MATVTDQANLRTTVADWLNRSDLTNAQLDQFIEMGESRVYELLRIPALEKTTRHTVTSESSSITIPSDFVELIEIRKTFVGSCDVSPTINTSATLCEAADGVWTSTSLSDDVILTRSDTRNLYGSNKHAIPYSFARDGNVFKITNDAGDIAASGTYLMRYYKTDPPVGSLYTNAESFRSTQTFCDSLVRQLDDTSGSTFTAYSPANGFGDCVIDFADVEKIPWLLGDYEMILYTSLAIASEYLGNDEDVARYTRLYMDKIQATNKRANDAELSGGNVSMRFQNFQGL